MNECRFHRSIVPISIKTSFMLFHTVPFLVLFNIQPHSSHLLCFPPRRFRFVELGRRSCVWRLWRLRFCLGTNARHDGRGRRQRRIPRVDGPRRLCPASGSSGENLNVYLVTARVATNFFLTTKFRHTHLPLRCCWSYPRVWSSFRQPRPPTLTWWPTWSTAPLPATALPKLVNSDTTTSFCSGKRAGKYQGQAGGQVAALEGNGWIPVGPKTG